MRFETLITVAAVSVVLAASGCAKKPAAMAAWSPAPGGSTGPPAPTSAAQPPTTPSSGGGAGSSARAPVPPDTRPRTSEFVAVGDVADVYFDFDKHAIGPDGARVIDANAKLLRRRGNDAILIEGHCDERGTTEYNLALGERRATAARNALIARGIDARTITIVSFGEDRPQCREHTEACWAKNRRARFLVKQQ